MSLPKSIPRTRILGKMMSQYAGKNVIIVGNLIKVNSNGDCVEIMTTDNVKINATIPTPLDGAAEGIIEVWGVVKSKGTLDADQYVHFDAEGSQNFDAKTYNNLITILFALHGKKWQLDKHV